jgi:hypothetical protein
MALFEFWRRRRPCWCAQLVKRIKVGNQLTGTADILETMQNRCRAFAQESVRARTDHGSTPASRRSSATPTMAGLNRASLLMERSAASRSRLD